MRPAASGFAPKTSVCANDARAASLSRQATFRPNPHTAMPLSFSKVWSDSGVDEGSKVHPAAMMVPAKGANLVLLSGAGKDLRFRPDRHFTVREITPSSSAAIKTATREVPELALPSKATDDGRLLNMLPFPKEAIDAALIKHAPGAKLDAALRAAQAASARVLLVEGKRRGLGTLTVVSGSDEASLSVWVRDNKTVAVNFHFVQDLGPNGRPRQRSTWNTAYAGEWVGLLNNIFAPQTNITFVLGGAKTLPVAQSLPAKVGLSQWQALKLKVTPASAVHVFLVGSWFGDKNDPLGSFIKASKHIVVDDRSTTDEFVTTVAHEIGHYLGASVNFGHPDPSEKDFLMTTVNFRSGAHIPQAYAQHFNPI